MKAKQLAYGIEEANCKYELRLARYVDFARRIHEERARKGSLKVLDAGCGLGRMIRYAGTEGLEWYGIDLNADNLRVASRQGPYVLRHGDLRKPLAYADEKFDVVILSHVLEHIEDPTNVIHNLRRAIKKGGMLLVGVPIFTAFTAWCRKYMVPVFDRIFQIPRRSHVYYFTIPVLKKMLERQGFEVGDVCGFRLFSASKVLTLENSYLFYRISAWWGRYFPNLTAEINCTARLL